MKCVAYKIVIGQLCAQICDVIAGEFSTACMHALHGVPIPYR